MKSLRMKISSRSIVVKMIVSLLLLWQVSTGWSAEPQKAPRTALPDREIIQSVKGALADYPAFVSSLVSVRESNNQRTLLIPFMSVVPDEVSGEAGERYRTFEAAVDMLTGFMVGGTVASMAKQPIQSITVLIFGETRHLAFQASVKDVRSLIAGSKTPEAFLANDLQVMTVANPVSR